MNDGGKLLPSLILLLTETGMVIIGRGQKLPLVSLSLVRKKALTTVEAGIRLEKAWETMP